jgi:NADPH-dependent ferric siderophore reductase
MSLENVEIIKGYARLAPTYMASPIVANQAIISSAMRFNPNQQIQIWQNTEVQDVRYLIRVGSATDEWYIGLYKFDYPNDKLVKIAQWDALAGDLTASGAITLRLASSITLTPATYYIGIKSLNSTAQGYRVNTNEQMYQQWTGDQLPNTTSAIRNFWQTAAPSSTLPSEVLRTDLALGFSNFMYYTPYLVY